MSVLTRARSDKAKNALVDSLFVQTLVEEGSLNCRGNEIDSKGVI